VPSICAFSTLTIVTEFIGISFALDSLRSLKKSRAYASPPPSSWLQSEPEISGGSKVRARPIGATLVIGTVIALAGYAKIVLHGSQRGIQKAAPVEPALQLRLLRDTWHMASLDHLPKVRTHVVETALRGYLVIAAGLVIIKVAKMMPMK
jgi:hypothetical protein